MECNYFVRKTDSGGTACVIYKKFKNMKKIARKIWAMIIGKKQPILEIPLGCEFAFEVGGKKYYKYSNELNIPVERALSAMDIYAELENKISNDYLRTLFGTITELCNTGKLVQIANLVNFANERLNDITHLDLMYKLASVIYIEIGEDYKVYDMAFNEKKIAFWKQHRKEVDTFFLPMPIGQWLPYLQSLETTLKDYSQMQAEEWERIFNYHTQLLSEVNDKSEWLNTLNLLKQKNSQLKNFLN